MEDTEINIGRLVGTEHVDADYTVGYSDGDILLISDARLLAEPNPMRLHMNALLLCTQGKGQLAIGGSTLQIATHQVLVCPPETLLSDFLFSPDFEFKAIFVSNRMLHRFMHERMRLWTDLVYVQRINVFSIDEEELELLTQVYGLIDCFLHSCKERPYRNETIQALLQSVFLSLCGMLEEMHEGEVQQERPHNADVLFRQFLDLLSHTAVKYHPVDWYAAELCVTPKYLSAVCKSRSGKTASEWIREHVLEDIRYGLQSSDLNIKQLSTQLGFPNTSFFGKYVKAHFGATPLSVRAGQGVTCSSDRPADACTARDDTRQRGSAHGSSPQAGG